MFQRGACTNVNEERIYLCFSDEHGGIDDTDRSIEYDDDTWDGDYCRHGEDPKNLKGAGLGIKLGGLFLNYP